MWGLIALSASNIKSAGAVSFKGLTAFKLTKRLSFMGNLSKAQGTTAWPTAMLTPVRQQPSDFVRCVGRAIDANTRL